MYWSHTITGTKTTIPFHLWKLCWNKVSTLQGQKIQFLYYKHRLLCVCDANNSSIGDSMELWVDSFSQYWQTDSLLDVRINDVRWSTTAACVTDIKLSDITVNLRLSHLRSMWIQSNGFTCVTRNCRQSSLPSCAAKYTGVAPLSALLFTELEYKTKGKNRKKSLQLKYKTKGKEEKKVSLHHFLAVRWWAGVQIS